MWSVGTGRLFSGIVRVPKLSKRSASDRSTRFSEASVSFEQLIEVIAEPGAPSNLVDQFEHHTGTEPVDLVG
jgi:hypothetical protein